MKKRIGRLVLLMAVVVGMVTFPQNMGKVVAAPMPFEMLSSVWVCVECKQPLTIEVHSTVYSYKRTGPCPDMSHVSLGCALGTVTYKDDYHLKCSGCPRDIVQKTEYRPVDNQHEAFVYQ